MRTDTVDIPLTYVVITDLQANNRFDRVSTRMSVRQVAQRATTDWPPIHSFKQVEKEIGKEQSKSVVELHVHAHVHV